MDLNDPEWATLSGGYRLPYDPRDALRTLEQDENTSAAWKELWNGLHHQGDVGEASYAAVPHLVRIYAGRRVPDWNIYALVATIEDARQQVRNPKLPAKLRSAYESALRQLAEIGLRELATAQDPLLVSSAIAVVAMWKGQLTLGRLASLFTEDERIAILRKAGWV